MKEKLEARGFMSEKHLMDFLDTCKDEGWKKELMDYYEIDSNKKVKEKVEETLEEPIEIVKETKKKK